MARKKTKKLLRKPSSRYTPAVRLAEVRNLINSTGGASVYDIQERLGVSVRTAHRYLKALEEGGEKLYDEMEGHQKVWRLMPSVRTNNLRLTTSQMMSLYLSRRVFDFLEGTGFKEDLDEIFRGVETLLRRKDFIAAQNLDRKLFDVNEAPYQYQGRIDDVNDIVTALVREDRLSVVHSSVSRARKDFVLDPYTLLVYKKGLYLHGYSHHHQSERTFALDGFKKIEWRKGDRFVYPEKYEPSKEFRGHFGLFKGPKTHVRIFFDESVKRFVMRRKWHPKQQIKTVTGGIEFSTEVEGTLELESWVLSFGDKAEVLEPPSLREALRKQLLQAMTRYRD
jgi:predicted DNA-binding transcriptional regulator YafY